MASHPSAAKRARQTLKITEHHRHFRSMTRTFVKRVRAAIAEGDKTKAQEVLKTCVKTIDQAVSKGLWHRKAGSRYISRLSSQVHALTAK